MPKRATQFTIALLLVFSVFSVPTAIAQDRIFNYTYQSMVLAPGQREIEVWNTVRWGHEDFFRAFNHRLEFEMGITRNLQTAFYLNIQESSSKMATTELGTNGLGAPEAVTHIVMAKESELSFSNEWKLRVLDPAADPIGFALYGEFLVRSNGIELEPRIILDKVVDRTILAFNASGEFEFENDVNEEGADVSRHSTSLELNLAGSTSIADGLYLGAETVVRTGFEHGAISYSALFAGPTLSYAQDKFWINFTILPQVAALKGATSNGLVLGELERFETRLLFSYAL